MKKALLLIIMAWFIMHNTQAQEFAGGAGTEEDPWQIETITHLNNLSNYLGEDHTDKHFIQTADILNGESFAGAIGNGSNPFMGLYDGNHFTIENIFISASQANYQGIFGYLAEAILRNIQIENINVTGSRYVGGLVGYAENSFFENITVAGEIHSHDRDAGGLAGIIDGGLVFNVSANISIVGGYRTGGMAGLITNEAEIRYSSSLGSVMGHYDVGGFSGSISSSAMVTDCYSHASVHGLEHQSIGGFTGNLSHSNRLYRSFSTGSVSVEEGDGGGGFIGARNLSNSASYCFWDMETSGWDTSIGDNDGVLGLTTHEMQQISSFPMFNFMSAWQMDEGNDYAEFQDFSLYENIHPVSLDQLSGSGTQSDPYVIHSAAEFLAIHENLNAHYILNNNISLLSSVIWNHGKGWLAIGTEDAPFTGSFDGGEFTLSDLSFNTPTDNNQGLFGYTQNAHIHNVTLENVHINGGDNTGALVGYAGNTFIENISIEGKIISAYAYIGGLVGYMSGGELSQGQTEVNVYGGVKAYSNIGGMVGLAADGALIQYSFSQGNVISEGSTGGFAGSISGSETLLINNYSHADISGGNNVGGFAGGTNWGVISNSYSTGAVSGNSNAGGFMGTFYGQSAVDCYWNTETSNQETSSGGSNVHGRTTEQMTYPHDENTYVDWDFMGIWDADENLNMGYPFIHLRDAAYMLSIQINPENSGYANGAGSYEAGTPIELTATPNTGYSFANWTNDQQEVVSNNPSFVFTMPEANTILTANFAINNYTIIAQANNADFGTVTGAGDYDHDEEVTLEATSNDGYHFVNWTEAGDEVSEEAIYTFTATSNRNLTAHFAEDEEVDPEFYTLSLHLNPENTGTVSGAGEYEEGEQILLTASANEGYVFESWKDAQENLLSNNAAFTFVMPAEDTELTAHFAESDTPDYYTLSLYSLPQNNTGGGAFGAGTFPAGTEVTIMASPNADFTFDQWIDETQSTFSAEAEHTFILNGNRVITAVFEGQSFEISTQSDMESGQTFGDGNYYLNEVVQVSAEAPENYQFHRWMKGDQQLSVLPNYLFSAQEDRNLIAEFVPDLGNAKTDAFLITAKAQPHHIGVVLNQGYYEQGETVSLIASPNVGLGFVKWTENGIDVVDNDGNLVGLEYEFVAEEDRELVAIFGGSTYEVNLSASPDEGGTLEGQGTYYPGDFAMVEATENPDFSFNKWSANGQQLSVNNSYGFTVTQNRELTAHFIQEEAEVQTYSLTLLVNPENTGTVSGAGEYEEGEQIALTASANDGYEFVNWTDEEDQEVSNTAELTFTMPDFDRTLTANFKEEDDDATVIISQSNNIKIYPNPSAGKVHIESESQINQITIIDISGRIVYNNYSVINNRYVLDAGAFENGLYILQLGFENYVVKRKLIFDK